MKKFLLFLILLTGCNNQELPPQVPEIKKEIVSQEPQQPRIVPQQPQIWYEQPQYFQRRRIFR